MQLKGLYLRALVFVPQVDAVKGIGTDDIRARPVRGAVALQVAGHRRLAPLGAIHGGRQGQVLSIQPVVGRERGKMLKLRMNAGNRWAIKLCSFPLSLVNRC